MGKQKIEKKEFFLRQNLGCYTAVDRKSIVIENSGAEDQFFIIHGLDHIIVRPHEEPSALILNCVLRRYH